MREARFHTAKKQRNLAFLMINVGHKRLQYE